MKEDLRRHYQYFPDEKLEAILRATPEEYTLEAREVAKELLLARGAEVADAPTLIEATPTLSNTSSKLNYKPLVIAVILLIFNFFAANVIYQYHITGNMEPEWLVGYLVKMGILHDILVRALVVVAILYYRDKHKGQYTILWVLAGMIFGAWALLAVGIAELFFSHTSETEPPKPDPEETTQPL